MVKIDVPEETYQALLALAAHDNQTPDDTLKSLISARQSKDTSFDSDFFALATNAVPGFFYVYDLIEDHNVYTNDTFQKMLGYSGDELRAMGDKAIPTLVHPDDGPKLAASIGRLLADTEDKLYNTTYRLRRRDDTWCWVYDVARVFKRTEDGKTWQIIGIATDISARKEIEVELENREMLYREAEAIAGFGHWEYDIATRLSVFSDGLVRLLELPVTDNRRPDFRDRLDMVHPDDRDIFERQLVQLIQKKEPQEMVWRHIAGDKTRHILVRSQPIVGSDGAVKKIFGVSFDITARVTAEAALDEQTTALVATRHFVDNITSFVPSAVYIFDLNDFKLVYQNREVGFGHVKEIGDSDINELIERYVHEDSVSAIYELVAQVPGLQDGDVAETTLRVTGNAGSETYVRVKATPFSRSDDGTIKEILIVSDDITQQKLAEIQLTDALVNERRLNALKAQLMQMISHQFRTPLSVIQTSAQILQRYPERLSAEAQSRHFAKLTENIAFMTRMLDEVLLVAQLQTGTVEMTVEAVDLLSLLREVCSTYAIDIPIHCVEDGVTVEVDHHLCSVVVRQIIDNAIQHGEPPVAISLDKRTSDVYVTVDDGGSGIDASDLPGIFEPFVRGVNAETTSTGLGLTIAREIVTLFGGTLTAENVAGQGARVTFCLPRSVEIKESVATD